MNILMFHPLLSKKSFLISLLGFSAGLPLLLIFSTLSVWLIKAGVERSTVTLFSWAGFAYSFKFIWTPLIDQYKLPILYKMGHRKSWLLISQLMIILFLIFTSFTDPSKNLSYTAIGVVCVAFASATQDIVIDAFRIESSSIKNQGALSSMYLAGYRIAMLVSGAGSLWLASYYGAENYNVSTWKNVYQIMASLMLIGVIATLLAREPRTKNNIKIKSSFQFNFLISLVFSIITFFISLTYLPEIFIKKNLFLNTMGSVVKIVISFSLCILVLNFLSKIKFISYKKISIAYIIPIKDFFSRYKKVAIFILLLIGLYRIADIVMGVMANIFYLEKGYKIEEIATYSKFFGMIATILGGFLGGLYSIYKGVIPSLIIGAIIAAGSNILFAWLAISKANITFLITVITFDNIASGFAGASFIVYLSSLTSIKFTATQYALFSSIMLFLPKLIAGYAGGMVDAMGYPFFFIMTATFGIPVIFLIYVIKRIGTIRK